VALQHHARHVDQLGVHRARAGGQHHWTAGRAQIVEHILAAIVTAVEILLALPRCRFTRFELAARVLYTAALDDAAHAEVVQSSHLHAASGRVAIDHRRDRPKAARSSLT
jgi:hypothetical protein